VVGTPSPKLEEVKDLIERAWVYEGATAEDIKASVARYLRIR
jgi:hypothetical protein